jgi:hypothetical protein
LNYELKHGIHYARCQRFHYPSCGELEIGKVVADEKRRIITQQIADSPEKSLKELKTALGDDCSYGDIKLVLAHLKHVENR